MPSLRVRLTGPASVSEQSLFRIASRLARCSLTDGVISGESVSRNQDGVSASQSCMLGRKIFCALERSRSGSSSSGNKHLKFLRCLIRDRSGYVQSWSIPEGNRPRRTPSPHPRWDSASPLLRRIKMETTLGSRLPSLQPLSLSHHKRTAPISMMLAPPAIPFALPGTRGFG